MYSNYTIIYTAEMFLVRHPKRQKSWLYWIININKLGLLS